MRRLDLETSILKYWLYFHWVSFIRHQIDCLKIKLGISNPAQKMSQIENTVMNLR